MAKRRRTQEERSSATRTVVCDAARRLFAERGYAATSIEEILAAADVTRGALYHHFDGKTALFLAVFEAVETDLTGRLVAAAAGKGTPWSRLLAGAQAFLDACLDPEIRRIVLLDAPAVLGSDEVRQVEGAHTMAVLRTALDTCAIAGDLERSRVPMLAHLMLGALAQAAVAIAHAENPTTARDEAWIAARGMLNGLRRR